MKSHYGEINSNSNILLVNQKRQALSTIQAKKLKHTHTQKTTNTMIQKWKTWRDEQTQTQTFYWTTMKSGFAKIQTYNKHTHRHEREWNKMKACRRNNNLDIRYAVRAIPVFLSCTRVYWYSRSNLKLSSLICSVGTYVYIYVLVHA